jgi:hypothetical protein
MSLDRKALPNFLTLPEIYVTFVTAQGRWTRILLLTATNRRHVHTNLLSVPRLGPQDAVFWEGEVEIKANTTYSIS